MKIDPRSVLPAHMQRLVQENEIAEAREVELAAYARQDRAAMMRRMHEHQEHIVEAATGFTTAEMLAARQARDTALAAAGWDPNAPVGSPAHPEVLIDGASTYSPILAEQAAVARYDQIDSMEAQLRRADDEAMAWRSDPAIYRMRLWSAQCQAARDYGDPPPRRQVPSGFRREVTRSAVVPVGDY